MKKTIRAAALFCCAAVALGLAGCAGRSTLLREAETAQPLSYAEYGDENLSALRSGAQAFSAKLSAALYAESAAASVPSGRQPEEPGKEEPGKKE